MTPTVYKELPLLELSITRANCLLLLFFIELAKGDKWVRPIIEGMIKTDPTQRSTLDEIETMLLNRLLAINKK